jgi:hypothetical protein
MALLANESWASLPQFSADVCVVVNGKPAIVEISIAGVLPESKENCALTRTYKERAWSGWNQAHIGHCALVSFYELQRLLNSLPPSP